MGTSIALSNNSVLRAGATRRSLLRKVVWRSLQLFIIGVIIINPNYCQGPCECKHTPLMTVIQTIKMINWSFHLKLSSHVLSTHLTCCTVSWENLRIPGVLQRLAWSYLVVACLDLLVARGHLDVYATVSQRLCPFLSFFKI